MNGPILRPRELDRRVMPIVERINCDHAPAIIELTRCCRPADMAPRLIVPSKTQLAPGHRHLHVDFRDFHFCHQHVGELKIDALLGDRLKASIEQNAKRVRPIDFKCDFEAAHLIYVNIFTPEYKYFELIKHLMPREAAQEAWGALIANG